MFLNVETYQNITKPNVSDIVKRTTNRKNFVRVSVIYNLKIYKQHKTKQNEKQKKMAQAHNEIC